MNEFVFATTDENFKRDVLESTLPVLVDFWAQWCGPCRRLAPTLEEVAKKYEGKVRVFKVNVDDCRNTATEYGIMSIPTLILFQAGQQVDTIVGGVSANQLSDFLDKHLNS